MSKIFSILAMTVLLPACGGQSNDVAPAGAPPAAAASVAAAASTTAVTTPAEADAAASAETAAAAAPGAAGADGDSEAGVAAAEAEAVAMPPQAPIPAPTDTGKWVEGKNYFRIEPQQARIRVSAKVEVAEVFSYGCPACFRAQPYMHQLATSLPPYAEMAYLPVSFRPDENFPLYQRAFYTAQAFGVAAKAHAAMFDAIWKDGKIGTYDITTGRPKPRDQWPTMEDIARFYANYGVDPAQFVATSQSFAINTKMRRADDMLKNWQVNSTPTIVIDGKYRLTPNSAGGYNQMLELTRWLIQKEGHAMQTTRQTNTNAP